MYHGTEQVNCPNGECVNAGRGCPQFMVPLWLETVKAQLGNEQSAVTGRAAGLHDLQRFLPT